MNQHIKILVVEDEAGTRLLLKRTLKKLGYMDVTVTDAASKALAIINNQEIDLVISDWHMPQMDGLEFFKAIKNGAILRKIPFVLLTVETEKEQVMKAMKLGIDQYMVKPIEPEELDARIKKVMNTVGC